MKETDFNTTMRYNINDKKKKLLFDACFDLGYEVSTFMDMILFNRKEYVKILTSIVIDKLQSPDIVSSYFTLSALISKHWAILTSYEKRNIIVNIQRVFDFNKISTLVTINEIEAMDIIFDRKSSNQKININY